MGNPAGSAIERLRAKFSYHFKDASLAQVCNTTASTIASRLQTTGLCPRPWMMQVEVTNRCNINCTICSRSVEKLQQGDMDPALLDAVVDATSRCQEVALFGYGEPLISKRFYTLLERLRCARIGFFTNGLLLGRELFDRITGMAVRPLSYIVFSIDGATARTYNAIRKGSDFDRVWKNLGEVAAGCAAMARPPALNIEFVAMQSTVTELADLVKMAADAGVTAIKVSHLVVWSEHLRGESLLYDPGLCRKSFEAAATAAEGRNIRLDLPKVPGAAAPAPAGPLPVCRYPWHYAMISYEGTVRACCFAPEFAMGSIAGASFDSIWRNPAYRRLRARLNTPGEPLVCRRCEERFRYVASPDDERTYIKLKPREK